MSMKNLSFMILCSFALMFASSGICLDDAGRMYQEGLFAEYGTGDLDKAIELYEQAFQNEYEDNDLAARILLRLGICYERVGRYGDAKDRYQQAIWRSPGQGAVGDEAAERLQELSSGLVSDGYWFRYKGEHIYLIGAGTASIYAGSGLAEGMPVQAFGKSLSKRGNAGQAFGKGLSEMGEYAPATDDPVRDWKAYIDLLVQHRINFVRFYPWDFLHRAEVPDYACPWLTTSAKPTYDLNSFNPKYWEKLREIISYASVKDILFEIVLFDDDADPWERHPFNQACGGALKERRAYHNLSNMQNKEYQEKYVERTMAETVDFPVVIYEICDAMGWQKQSLSRAMRNWVLYWISFIEERLPLSSNHLITVSQHSWSSGKELDTLWELPGIDIISVHESEGTKFALDRDYTRRNFLKYWQSGYQKPIMMNETSFGDMSGHPEGGTRGWAEERQHLWVAFASGGHAARSDFQPFIDTQPSLDSCLHLANFVRHVSLWGMSPLVDFVISCDGKCYSLGSDREFVVYIRAGGKSEDGKIKLKLPRGRYKVRWYDPTRGNFLADEKAISGGEIALQLPEIATDIALYMKKQEGN